jgi:hypothetical protein
MANNELQADLEIGGVDQAIGDLKRKLSGSFDDPKIGSGFTKGLRSEIGLADTKAKQLNSSLKEVAGTFGLAFGTAAVVGGALKFLNDAKTASLENVKSNRLLASSATEAGKAYADLADENERFAKAASLSTTESAGLLSKIQQLATFSGKPENSESLQKGFLDLGAAKGIAGPDLQNLIGTILSGQDEGLNRLGLPDPSKIYEAYGKQIGVAGDKLNQFQKVQAATNAVLEKAAVFAGANNDRLETTAGKAESASAATKELYTNFGNALTNSIEFQNALSTLNGLLEAVSVNAPKVRKALGDGVSPRDVAIQEGNKPFNQVMDAVGDFTSPVGAALGFGFDAITGKSTTEAVNNFYNSIGGTHKRRIDQLTQTFSADLKDVKKQTDAAVDEKGKLAGKTFIANFDSTVEGLLNPANKGVEKTKATVADVIKLQKDLAAHLDELGGKGSDQAKAAQAKIDQVYRAAIASGLEFQKALSTFNSNAVDQYLAYGKARIAAENAGEDGDRIKVIREQSELELAALGEKIRLVKELSNEQRKALSPDELQGEKGTTLALETIESVNKLLYQQEILRLETKNRINEETEKELEKARELEKTYKSTFAGLYQKASPDNPFVQVFTDADKALDDLRENLKKFSPEIQSAAKALQQQINSNSLFSARVDNDLEVFDLKERARELRNPKLPKIEDTQKFFSEFIEKGLKQILDQNGGAAAVRYNLTGDGKTTQGFSQSKADPYTRYNSNIFAAGKNPDGSDKLFTAGFSQSDGKGDLFTNYHSNIFSDSEGNQYTAGFSQSKRTFSDLTEAEKSQFFDKSQSQENQGVNQRLQEQFQIIQSQAFTPEQQALADSKFIALTKGLDPKDLSKQLREAAGLANEREADRRVKNEAKSQFLLQSISNKLSEGTIKVSSGETPVVDIEIRDATLTATQNALGTRATSRDAAGLYTL